MQPISSRGKTSKSGRITERSLYSAIKSVFREYGAKTADEVKFDTEPDIIVRDWHGRDFIVSVKIGDPAEPRLLKDAFIQYVSHMRDTGIEYGMIIFYPESIRKVEPSDDVIERIVRLEEAYFVVLNPQMELRTTLPKALLMISDVLARRVRVTFSLETVVRLLREQIEDIMNSIGLEEIDMAKFLFSPELFFGLNPVEENEEKRKEILFKVFRFLAAYIFLSQLLFLRFYVEKRPGFLEDINIREIARNDAKILFKRIKDVNYKPIFEYDVLDIIPEKLIRATFNLILNLQVENVRYELPGRLFHELMPGHIRKLLAAFYTRPTAAYLLASLCIEKADAEVFDPACGSGTILAAAYRVKKSLWDLERLGPNPHKIFCEKQIYGCDIMPFAVHITNANLASLEPLERIDLTQIALADSLKLTSGQEIAPGFQSLTRFLPITPKGSQVNVFTRTGETTKITLKPVDVVLMNPPFTKVERGVKKYINLGRFEKIVGGEVGLWGHFVALANEFLKDEGILGAVLPINLLRGRESEKVRRIIFQEMVPLYIIKATKNYGFSEYAEYRDLLVVAKKSLKMRGGHKVKFCLIKKNLNKLKDWEVEEIARLIKTEEKIRSDLLDIDSYDVKDVLKKFDNMMPFISGPSFSGKDALRRITEEAERIFSEFPREYFKEGYGPRPEGVSKIMFITNPIRECRIEEAFMVLDRDLGEKLVAKTIVGIQRFILSKEHFIPSLRTPVGLSTMDITNTYDYVAKEPYEYIDKIIELSAFKKTLQSDYWNKIKKEFERSKSFAGVVRRINPFSPNQHLIAFCSQKPLVFSDTLHAINESNENIAKAIVVLLNSIFFLASFFQMKEESTGRYIDIRQYDLFGTKLYPSPEQVNKLVNVYEKYKEIDFPPLRDQIDKRFNERYKSFWNLEKEGQKTLIPLDEVKPHELRLKFDMDVIKAVGAKLTEKEVIEAYKAIAEDMIITRGLKKD